MQRTSKTNNASDLLDQTVSAQVTFQRIKKTCEHSAFKKNRYITYICFRKEYRETSKINHNLESR